MAKSLFRALVALSFLAPLWLNAAPRVIPLSPANTELAFAAGITPVGVSSYSDYPPQAQKIGQVSTWQGMNLERIVALKPDLVVDCGNADETWLSQARQVNAQTPVPWLLINGELRQTPAQLQAAGAALGTATRASAQAALARRFIDDADAFSHSPAAKLRFYAARGARGLETGLQGSLHTEAPELLGLHNVAQIPGRHGLTQVSMENLLSWQPDIILVQDAVTAQYLREDPVWQGAKAVADRRILFLSGLPLAGRPAGHQPVTRITSPARLA